MKIFPKNGVDNLLFGMKPNDVIALLGKPDRSFDDEDKNTIFLYNQHKLRLTFYEDENFKLGYIICSNNNATIFEKPIIGKTIEEVKNTLPISIWEKEIYDSVENYFNESNWLILQTEYNEVIRIEIGAIINDNDQFEWKFKA